MKQEGKIIGIVSIKGGVGKTSCTANLGAALATEFNKDVLMIDANFSAPNLGIHVGVIEPDITIHDVMKGKTKVKDAIINHEHGFDIIPASLLYKKIDHNKLKQKIQHLKKSYDFILIDSSPNMKDEMIATILAADEILIITSPDYPTLSTTLMAVKLANQKNTPVIGIIVNRVKKRRYELTVDEIERTVEIPVLGVLPEDTNVAKSIAETVPVILYQPKSKAAVEFKKIAACIAGEEFKDPRLWHRVKAKFKQKPKEEVNRVLYKNGI
ncbi:hypothetical protein D6777_02300 [Candidatus Woesearchaeota archaeon]|nr:MAG: hypothetical protein D6777_02300 [Candidatus Woesearchaeota archaeon]